MAMRNYKNWGMKDWFSIETTLLVRGNNSASRGPSLFLCSACGRMLCLPEAAPTSAQVMATSGSLEQRAQPCWNANKQQINYPVSIFWCLFSVISIGLMVLEHGWNKAMFSCCQHSSRGGLGIRWYLCWFFSVIKLFWTTGEMAVDKYIIPSILWGLFIGVLEASWLVSVVFVCVYLWFSGLFDAFFSNKSIRLCTFLLY